ncbi:putative inorganic phosphate cotransporter [Diprion similis]|uniref:putative inorganic phosphate cotransporter n=1 Tax=Diprion similis TaxID=362088 RepID=UPI001EF7F8CD|nr:putative inorganic phosphate cotransporter [Diprion similis]
MLSSWKVCCARVPQRWIVPVMLCLAMTALYTMRISLSIAITQMVAAVESSSNGTSSDETCPPLESTSSSTSASGTYQWDEYTQGIILSSFYWGYLINQIPGGILADKYGGKTVAGLSVLTSAILTLLIPVIVEAFGATGLIVIRFLVGLGSASIVPAVGVLISRWAPPHERSKMDALALSGIQVGTVIGNALSGVLISYSSIGWPIVFYVYGGLGMLWYPIWMMLCYNNPDVHPFITETEKEYLQISMKEHMRRKPGPIPWKFILTSVPVWAMLAGRVGYSWGFHVMVTDLPKYMNSVLKFSIKANGFLTALPYLVLWFVNIGSSWVADWLIKSGKVSRTNVRKIFMTIASMSTAVFIVAASYAGCNRALVIVFFTIGVGSMGLFYPSAMVNSLDLAPNYSGTVTAVGGVMLSLVAILAPYVVGVITPNQTLSEWRIVFWITFVVYFVTLLVVDVWADGEVQHWNNLNPQSRHQDEVKNETRTTDKVPSST